MNVWVCVDVFVNGCMCVERVSGCLCEGVNVWACGSVDGCVEDVSG